MKERDDERFVSASPRAPLEVPAELAVPAESASAPCRTAPVGFLALILMGPLVVGQACNSSRDECPAEMLALFEEENPQTEIVACQRLVTRKFGRPDGIYEEMQFSLSYRSPTGGKVRYETWTYEAKDDGPLEVKGRGEIIHFGRVECPADMLARFGAENPQAEIVRCEGLEPNVRPDETHERVQFFLDYRNPGDGKNEKEVWTYRKQDGGQLELQDRRELQLQQPLQQLSRSAARAGDKLAATAYRFTISKQNDFGHVSGSAGRVWAFGEKFRIQYGEGETSPALVSEGDGNPTFKVEPASKIYYDYDPQSSVYVTKIGMPQRLQIEDLGIELEKKDETRIVDEWTAQQHVLQATFTIETDFQTEFVKEHFTAELSLWTTSGFASPEPPSEVNPRHVELATFEPLSRNAVQQLEEVEQQIADTLASIEGFPLKSRLKITRRFDGGEPRIDIRTIELDRFAKIEVPPSTFGVPAEFAEQAPAVSGIAPQRAHRAPMQ